MNNSLNLGTIASIQNMYRSDSSFEKLIDWFSERQKNSLEMPVRIAGVRTGLSEGEIKKIFQKLAQLGCGRYIKGSRGYESRMQWDKSIISIAAAAKGEARSIEVAPSNVSDPLESEGDKIIPEGYIEHNFALRPNVLISLTLPADLSSREAERIASFVQTLPFSV